MKGVPLESMTKDEIIKLLRIAQRKNARITWEYKKRPKKPSVKLAKKMANEMMDRYRLDGFGPGGMMAFSTIVIYANKVGMTPGQMAYMILLCLTDSMTTAEGSKFGFLDCKNAHNWINSLKKLELVEKIDKRYVASVLARRIFNDFRVFYRETTCNLIKTDAYKQYTYRWKRVGKPDKRVK